MTLTSGEPALQVAATGERLERGAVSTLKASDDWMHVCVVVFVEVGIVALLADSLFHRPARVLRPSPSRSMSNTSVRPAGSSRRSAGRSRFPWASVSSCTAAASRTWQGITFTHVQGVLTFTCTYLHTGHRAPAEVLGHVSFALWSTRVEREGCRDADGGKKQIQEVEHSF